MFALHNAGYDMSDGHQEAAETLADDDGQYIGYCFYHGQDVERAVDGGGLWVAFDHVEDDVPEKRKVGDIVKEELDRVGLTVNWDGSMDKRIYLAVFDWKHRHDD